MVSGRHDGTGDVWSMDDMLYDGLDVTDAIDMDDWRSEEAHGWWLLL